MTLTNAGRLRLRFIAFDQLEYEIRYRPNVDANWSGPIPFSLTLTGPADRTSVLGQADYAEVYLDRATSEGFYAVVMRIQPV